MQIVRPYVDENKQVVFVELEHDSLHNVTNGLILGVLVSVLLGVLLP